MRPVRLSSSPVVSLLVVTLVAASLSAIGLGALGACKRQGAEAPDLPPLDAVPAGAHDVVRAQYNDTNDVYRVFLAGRPVDAPLRLRGVRLALLTAEQIAAGKKPHLLDDGAGPLLLLGPRFKIGVLHGVVEERVDDEGKRQNVVTRTQRKLWSPFLVAKLVDGKSFWHMPAVHYPPPVSPGPLVGSGGSGATREAAWDDYRRRHGVLPQAVRLEFEGYVLAKDLPKDDGRDRGDEGDEGNEGGDAHVDAGAAGLDATPTPTPTPIADAGSRGGGKRVIGVVPGSRAVAAHEKARAEKRRKQVEEAARKRLQQQRAREQKAKATP